MATPLNPALYQKAKKIADEKYSKPSAYKSGFIVKTYKDMGGTYADKKGETKNLKRWFEEDWQRVNPTGYPVLRPTKRISKRTPLLAKEINPKQLKQQVRLKQRIKGKSNLPAFKGGMIRSDQADLQEQLQYKMEELDAYGWEYNNLAEMIFNIVADQPDYPHLPALERDLQRWQRRIEKLEKEARAIEAKLHTPENAEGAGRKGGKYNEPDRGFDKALQHYNRMVERVSGEIQTEMDDLNSILEELQSATRGVTDPNTLTQLREQTERTMRTFGRLIEEYNRAVEYIRRYENDPANTQRNHLQGEGILHRYK